MHVLKFIGKNIPQIFYISFFYSTFALSFKKNNFINNLILRAHWKQCDTTIGLDIYFEKVKPSKGVNVNSVEELSADRTAQHKKAFNKVMNKYIKRIKEAIVDGNLRRSNIIPSVRDYVKETMVYDWYWEPISDEKSDQELLDIIKKLKKQFYPHEDVYFRKANFVYRFFQPYLVDEECIVTKDMVTDLLKRCDEIIAAAQTDGVITPDGNIDERFFCCKGYNNLPEDEQKAEYERAEKENKEMPRDWVGVATDLLPTTSGFFFGSTEYDVWYLYDIISCKTQFEKLLADWKDDEVVYNIMSW